MFGLFVIVDMQHRGARSDGFFLPVRTPLHGIDSAGLEVQRSNGYYIGSQLASALRETHR